jgi:TolB-like protein
VQTLRYRFGEYQLDPSSRELCRGGVTAPVEPQVFDLLLYLIQHRERVVSKDELIATVWNGRIVSESALFNRINAARRVVGDCGEQQRLIKTLPRKGIRFIGEVREEDTPGGALREDGLALPDRPSLAVLPFTNMTGKADQEYFADGISEDLITGLARIRWLFVIARNSAFVYKHRSVDVKQVSRELGVRYVLEGSVRRARNRVRISAQLVDAVSGGHHWGEHYDRKLGDVFAVQDEITRSVAAAIEPRLLAAEGIRALARTPEHLGAWELVASAQAHAWRLTREDYGTAIESLQRTVRAHPDYAPARGLLAFCLVIAAHMGWAERGKSLPCGREHAIRALALDDRDPWGHIALGYWAMMERRTEESIAAFDSAVRRNPNSAAAHAHLSRGLAFAGRDVEAIEHGQEAIRLSPLDPDMALFLGGLAIAHFSVGRYGQAALHAAEALHLRPGFYGPQRLRCASLAQAGRLSEARKLLAEACQQQPQLTLRWLRENVPWQTPDLMERFLKGMRRAGLRDD